MLPACEEGFVRFEDASALAVVLAPVSFHSSEGDKSPNKRGNFSSERRRGEEEEEEVKTQQRLPPFLYFYIVSEGLSTD